MGMEMMMVENQMGFMEKVRFGNWLLWYCICPNTRRRGEKVSQRSQASYNDSYRGGIALLYILRGQNITIELINY